MGKLTMSDNRELPRKRYRIGELVEHSGLSRQTLHNYTRWGLIQEVGWTAGGHRVYGEEALGRLDRIVELKRSLSIAEIRTRLDAPRIASAIVPRLMAEETLAVSKAS